MLVGRRKNMKMEKFSVFCIHSAVCYSRCSRFTSIVNNKSGDIAMILSGQGISLHACGVFSFFFAK